MTARGSDRQSPTARERSTLEQWLGSQPSANTRAAYRKDLELFARWCAMHETLPLTAERSALVAFQSSRKAAGDSGSTIRRRWSALSSFYDFAVEAGVRPSNPSHGVDRPKVASGDPSPTMRLTQHAVATYRAAAADIDPRLEALVALLVCDGLKVGEALALDIEDVSGRSPTMKVIVRRRGGAAEVILDRESGRSLRRCIGARDSGPVFVSGRSARSDEPSRLTRFGADHLIRQLRTESAAAPVTASALRRFHITMQQRLGTTLDDVRDRAGLSDVRGVRRYLDGPDEPDDDI